VLFASPEWAGYEGGVFPSITAAMNGEGGNVEEEIERVADCLSDLAKWLSRGL
jgi:hypothetical protein